MTTDDKQNTGTFFSRRGFLRILGTAGFSTAVAAGLTLPRRSRTLAARHSGGVEGEHRWGMVIDLSTCIGCSYCVYACQATNDTTDDMRWNVYLLDMTETGQPFHMTRPCMHCQDAPCVTVCPVGATYQRGDGTVAMDYDRCIGCRYCMVACPYDARRFNWLERTDENPYQPEWGSAEVERRPRGTL